MKSVNVAVKCPYGCGRFILADRIANHAIIARVEHEVCAIERMKFQDAYDMVVASCAS